MDTLAIISVLIIIINVFVSYKGFKDHAFFQRYAFGVDKVLLQKDYKVLVTSGFLHVGWVHLILNMFSLYVFSEGLESYIGAVKYMLIYFASLLGGGLFSLLVHKNHGDYTAVGASGAVCGIIFASIALFPGMGVGFFFIPVSIPAWLYGIAFVLYSIYGIRSRSDNIGHEAHLAGALVGLITAVLLVPRSLDYNLTTILLIFIPSVIFIYFIVRRPATLMVDNRYFKKRHFHTIDDRYNIHKKQKQQEIDRILEKIHRRGMGSLTEKEKDYLNRNT
ncbi:MAG TPA: rhomboid family intramembrane serine protease [Chitinophagaceae bacterium]|nr:rhomboid family intramembrane serine protease [Chitinophagaceae bacterium]